MKFDHVRYWSTIRIIIEEAINTNLIEFNLLGGRDWFQASKTTTTGPSCQNYFFALVEEIVQSQMAANVLVKYQNATNFVPGGSLIKMAQCELKCRLWTVHSL